MASTSMSSGRWWKPMVCATIGGTYLAVKGMNASEVNTSRSTDVTDTFEGDTYSEAGTRDRTYTLNGGWISDDPGQLVIRAAESTDAIFYYKPLPSGYSSDATENVRGMIAPVRAGSIRGPSATIGSKQTWGVDLLPDGTPAATGTGGYVF